MAKKKTSKKKAPRKKLTSERPLKNRPVDEPEPPETEAAEPGDGSDAPTGEEEEELVTVETSRKRGRQKRLPTMEDAAIEELESLAEDYRGALDERMEALKTEIDLKDKLLASMKHHGKEKYFHAGVSIEVVNSKDKVKVRINKDGE